MRDVITQQDKFSKDVCADFAFLRQSENTEAAMQIVAHKYRIQPDEVYQIWDSRQEEEQQYHASVREKCREDIVADFEYLLKRNYQTEFIAKMVGFKFNMKAESAYRIWRDKYKPEKSLPTHEEARAERLP